MNITNQSNLITPCLWCKDDALAKAEYYCSLFPNSKILSQHPAMVLFELNGMKFQAMKQLGNSVAVSAIEATAKNIIIALSQQDYFAKVLKQKTIFDYANSQ